ncbi:MAG: PDZ domain-containing protein [Pyrinomonadaceae bacterium]
MKPPENFGNSSAADQICSQCGSPMPKDMRFCRSCGNRLGEGPAEYTETVRLPGSTSQQRSPGTTPFYPTFNAPMATVNPIRRRRRLGFAGTTWLWIVLVAFFAMGGIMSLARKNRVTRPPFTFTAPRSWVGVNQFDTTDGGVTFKNVDAPGGPADKAGLVGGDIITSFDGHPVKRGNEMMDLLIATPVGKQVEVIYSRDGVFHNTQLTTISQDEFNRLQREYDSRPEGKGMFGFESNRMTRIKSPETKTFGVRIDYVEPNGPADLFGIKEGDIITDFDKIPIRTPEEFLARVRRAKPRSIVSIVLLRNGQQMTVPVTIGKTR